MNPSTRLTVLALVVLAVAGQLARVSGSIHVHSRIRGPKQVQPHVEFQSTADSVESLRKSIGQHFDLPLEQVGLTAGGQQLKDGKTLADYGLEDDAEVNFSPRQAPDGSYPIFVRSFSNDAQQPDIQVYLSVKATNSLTVIREKLHAKTGLKHDKLSMLFSHAKSLDDNYKTLADYKIRAGDEIKLILSRW